MPPKIVRKPPTAGTSKVPAKAPVKKTTTAAVSTRKTIRPVTEEAVSTRKVIKPKTTTGTKTASAAKTTTGTKTAGTKSAPIKRTATSAAKSSATTTATKTGVRKTPSSTTTTTGAKKKPIGAATGTKTSSTTATKAKPGSTVKKAEKTLTSKKPVVEKEAKGPKKDVKKDKKTIIMEWCQELVKDTGITIKNWGPSFGSGLAFVAIMRGLFPDKISEEDLKCTDKETNFELAFATAEAMGQDRFLDVEDCVDLPCPDSLSTMAYVFELYRKFGKNEKQKPILKSEPAAKVATGNEAVDTSAALKAKAEQAEEEEKTAAAKQVELEKEKEHQLAIESQKKREEEEKAEQDALTQADAAKAKATAVQDAKAKKEEEKATALLAATAKKEAQRKSDEAELARLRERKEAQKQKAALAAKESKEKSEKVAALARLASVTAGNETSDDDSDDDDSEEDDTPTVDPNVVKAEALAKEKLEKEAADAAREKAKLEAEAAAVLQAEAKAQMIVIARANAVKKAEEVAARARAQARLEAEAEMEKRAQARAEANAAAELLAKAEAEERALAYQKNLEYNQAIETAREQAEADSKARTDAQLLEMRSRLSAGADAYAHTMDTATPPPARRSFEAEEPLETEEEVANPFDDIAAVEPEQDPSPTDVEQAVVEQSVVEEAVVDTTTEAPTNPFFTSTATTPPTTTTTPTPTTTTTSTAPTMVADAVTNPFFSLATPVGSTSTTTIGNPTTTSSGADEPFSNYDDDDNDGVGVGVGVGANNDDHGLSSSDDDDDDDNADDNDDGDNDDDDRLLQAREQAMQALEDHDAIKNDQHVIAAARQQANEALNTFAQTTQPNSQTEQEEEEEDDEETSAQAAKRDEWIKAREQKKKEREIRAQDIFAKPGNMSEADLATAMEDVMAKLMIKPDTVTEYIACRDSETKQAAKLAKSFKPNDQKAAVVIRGMHRLESQLQLLPKVFAMALLECNPRDKSESRAVADRVQDIRTEYLLALHRGNTTLSSLGFPTRELERYDDCLAFHALAVQAGVPRIKGDGNSTVAHQIDINAGADADFLSDLGLLSGRSREEASAPLYDESQHGANVGLDEEEQDYVDIKDLLKEIDDEVLDTQVTVSDPMCWIVGDTGTELNPLEKSRLKVLGIGFVDFCVELETDESVFASNKSLVRRTYEEFQWLARSIEEEVEMEPPAPLPELKVELINGGEGLESLEYLEDLGTFLSNLAEDAEFQSAKCLHQFLFDDDIPDVRKPSKFTTVAVEEGTINRALFASLPITHLVSIASYYGADVSKCSGAFEYADRILAHVHPALFEDMITLDGGAVDVDDQDQDDEDEEAILLTDQDRRLVTFRAFIKEKDGVIKLPLTVELFLGLIGLDTYRGAFTDNGYDDLRLIATLDSEELIELITDADDRSVVLKAGFEWNLAATSFDLLDTTAWARETHRAVKTGVFDSSLSTGKLSEAEAIANIAEVAKNMGESQLSPCGTYYIGADGRMDLKHGDEDVQMGFGDTLDWDPTPILKVLYDSPCPLGNDDAEEDEVEVFQPVSTTVIVEGFLDKLPKGSTLKSLMKRWARKYFKAVGGELVYYADNKSGSRPQGQMKLLGAEVIFGGGSSLIVTEKGGEGHMIMRAGSTRELEHWKLKLDEAAAPPQQRPIPTTEKKTKQRSSLKERSHTVILDVGGASSRAGFGGSQPDASRAWPEIFLPTVIATNKESGAKTVGHAALAPESRRSSKISYPLRLGDSMDQKYNMRDLEHIYRELYAELDADPSEFNALLTEPQNMTEKDRTICAEIMFETFNVPSLYMKPQPLLAMFSYGATSGVIVDCGERMDVVPLDQGYVFEKGISHLRLGGRHATERMQRIMSQKGHRFFSDAEFYISRLVKERTCFVAPNFEEAQNAAAQGLLNPEIVDCRRFAIPDGSKIFKVTEERFLCTEGFFRPTMWGKDNDGIAQLVHKAIQSADIDLRKGLARNIYLSGGTTMMEGFADRLEEEVEELMPASCEVAVHAGPFRQHAAYRGAAVVASLNNFESMCVWQDDWHEKGPSILSKFREDMERPPADMLYSSEDDDDDSDDDETTGFQQSRKKTEDSDDDESDDDDDDDDDSD